MGGTDNERRGPPGREGQAPAVSHELTAEGPAEECLHGSACARPAESSVPVGRSRERAIRWASTAGWWAWRAVLWLVGVIAAAVLGDVALEAWAYALQFLG